MTLAHNTVNQGESFELRKGEGRGGREEEGDSA